LGVFYVYALGHETGIVRKLYARIDMNAENNAPSLFSFAILLFASLLLFLVSKVEIPGKTGERRYWRFLTFVFLFLSFDEAFSVHEKFSAIKNYISFGDSSILKHAWILPYGLGVIILGLFVLKFFLRLPKRTQALFFISGVLYCFSAIGFELIESYVAIKVGNLTELYALCGIEEFMEMCSIILFIHALFDYLISIQSKILIQRDTVK
jgi:hypothetical protein